MARRIAVVVGHSDVVKRNGPAVVVGHSDVVKRNGPQPERKCGPFELIRNKWPAESLTLRAIRADPEQMAHRIADTAGLSSMLNETIILYEYNP